VFSCEDVLATLGAYLDDEATEDLRHQIEEHLTHCRTCEVMYDSAKKTLKIVTDSGVFEVPVALSESLVSKTMSRIRSGETEHSPD
jgi:anti-sigma factor (TIGR02949 family)